MFFDQKKYDQVPKKAQFLKRSYENLPSSFVLTDYTPPIGDQGNFGTCVAWASTYAGMTTAEALSKGNKNVSREDIFSPYYLYRKCNPTQFTAEQVTGMYPEDALLWLKNEGVPRRSYNELLSDYATFSMDEYEDADLFKIESYSTLGKVFDITELTDTEIYRIIRNIKKSISERKPVLGAFWVTEEFCNCTRKDFLPSNLEADLEKIMNFELGGHAMLIVGYDDHYYYNSYNGAFLIQNSWGKEWGYNGYIWINYELACIYLKGAYEISNAITKVQNESVVYNYDYSYEDEDDWWWYYTPEPTPEQEPAPLFDPEPEPEPYYEPELNNQVEEDNPPKFHRIFEGSFTLPVFNEDEELKVMFNNTCYETTQFYDSFTRFQLYMTNKRPCYVYAFASDDATKKATKIFPTDNVNPLLDYHENTVVYPSEDTCIRMDDQTGNVYLIVLYSLSELDLPKIMKNYEKEIHKTKYANQVVINACGKDKIVPFDYQHFETNSINFSADVDTVSKNAILPIIIKIKHK